jgi:hypothetical protein
MEPFNNDWTNSLFFSQDPIAIDSVMYDFLYAEGTNPTEGCQNYLHQGAEPLPDTYDPEGDGIYLSNSIGVHEHWDTSFEIWEPERYSGPEDNGIDFVTFGKEHSSIRIKNRPLIQVLNELRSFLKQPNTNLLERIVRLIRY